MHDTGRRKRGLLGGLFVLLGGITLAVILVAMRGVDRRDHLHEVETKSIELATTFRKVMATELQVLYSLRGLYAASMSVEPSEFETFHQQLAASLVGVEGLEFVALVAPAARSGHEAMARQDGLAGYRIWSGTAAGPEGARGRTVHLPIDRTAPGGTGLTLLGRDLAADLPGFALALGAAAASDSLFAVPAPDWWPCEAPAGDLLVGLPVFANRSPTATPAQRGQNLIGAVMASVDTGVLAMHARSEAAADWLHVVVLDCTEAAPVRMYTQPGGEGSAAERAAVPLDDRVAGRRLRLVCSDLRTASVPWSARTWSVMLGSALSLWLALAYARSARRNTLRIEATVQLRTAELEQSTALMTAIVGSAPDLIANLDRNCLVVVCNDAGAAMLGLSPWQLVGRPFAEVLAGEGAVQLIAFLDQGAEAQRLRLSTRARRADGTSFPIELTASRVPEAGLVTVIGRDVTHIELEKLHAEQQRQGQKLEAIGQLAAGIAHEINTPIQFVSDNVVFLQGVFTAVNTLLRSVPEMIEMLSAAGMPPDRIAELQALRTAADLEFIDAEIPLALTQSRDGLMHVAEIVRAMKEFSHPADGMVMADLNCAIKNTVTVARNEWKQVAEVDLQLAADLPLVPCQPGEINQVILNLVVNAAQAIGDVVGDGAVGKGTITVRTGRDGPFAIVEVRDTGAGIPAAIRGRIFESFFTTKAVGKGTGQGLAIAHNVVVTKHRGTITFSSEVGRGTTFRVRLPLAPVGAEVS